MSHHDREMDDIFNEYLATFAMTDRDSGEVVWNTGLTDRHPSRALVTINNGRDATCRFQQWIAHGRVPAPNPTDPYQITEDFFDFRDLQMPSEAWNTIGDMAKEMGLNDGFLYKEMKDVVKDLNHCSEEWAIDDEEMMDDFADFVSIGDAREKRHATLSTPTKGWDWEKNHTTEHICGSLSGFLPPSLSSETEKGIADLLDDPPAPRFRKSVEIIKDFPAHQSKGYATGMCDIGKVYIPDKFRGWTGGVGSILDATITLQDVERVGFPVKMIYSH